MWRSPKTVDERVVLMILATVFLLYNFRMSRTLWKWLDLSQLTRKGLSEVIAAQPPHGRCRVQKVVPDAGRASASTGFLHEIMITVKWIPTWRKVYQYNTG